MSIGSHDSIIIVTKPQIGWPRDQSSFCGRCKRFFSSPRYPDQFWGPPSLQLTGCQVLLSHYLI